MLQKDHLMRMIQQFTNVMATVLALKKDGRMQEALDEIRQMTSKLVTGGAERIGELSTAQLLDRLTHNGTLDPQRAMMMADLLAEEADVHFLEARPDAASAAAQKSLSMLLAAYKADPSRLPADFFERVDRLLGRLEGDRLDPFLMWQLFHYFEAAGVYDQAENVLFKLAETGDPEARAQAAAFYDRLEERTDDELAKGNLPRDEISQGRADFESIFTPKQE